MAMPASITTLGGGCSDPHSWRSRAMASASVPHSETLPGRISHARGKPALSSISAVVTSGQSFRRCFERPRRRSTPLARPQQWELVRS